MHSRITEILDYMDREHAAAKAIYDAIPATARARRPVEGAWSPAEVVGHLVLIEGRVAGAMTAVIAKAREAGIGAETQTSPVLPTIDVKPVLDRSAKITAPAPVDPHHTQTQMDWKDYEAVRSALKAALAAGDGLDLSAVTHPHPLFGPLTIYQWGAFVAAHEARHAAQMKEAAAALG